MNWKKLDEIKRRLFGKLRDETSFDYLKAGKMGFEKYRERFERIPEKLWNEWLSIKEKNKDHPNLPQFKGAIYETLFYYACLNNQAVFFDADILEFGGKRFDPPPPWFVAIPIYDIIPQLHQIWEDGKWKRCAPQVNADFIMSYVDHKGPLPPALTDVKSYKPVFTERFGWQIRAAMRMGFIFQVAYPKRGIDLPKSLEDWKIRTPCWNCKKLSTEYRICSSCGKKIFPYTIVDARYKLKDLMEMLGLSYRGRF